MTTEKVECLLNQLQDADAELSVEIIKSVTEMPGIFVFGEFLDQPSIQALQQSTYSAFYKLLELFCYGSFDSLQPECQTFPTLSSAQLRKLKQLTIIDEAHTNRHIPYDLLFSKLKLSSSRELEDLIIDLFYLGALSGKLDQQKAMLEVESVIGRDIRADEIPKLNDALDTWLTRVQSVLTHMADEIKLATTRRLESEHERKRVAEAVVALRESMQQQMSQDIQVDTQRMEIDDSLIHPDHSSLDGNRGTSLRPTGMGGVDTPAGDKEPRSKNVFKNLRKKQ